MVRPSEGSHPRPIVAPLWLLLVVTSLGGQGTAVAQTPPLAAVREYSDTPPARTGQLAAAQAMATLPPPEHLQAPLLAAFGVLAATAATMPFDRRIAATMAAGTPGPLKHLDPVVAALPFVTRPGVFLLGATAYTIGLFTDNTALARGSVHSMEAVLLAAGAAGFLKVTIGRNDPAAAGDSVPGDYQLGGGFQRSSRRSLPSGHTAIAFAAAAAVTAEVNHWSPRVAWGVGPALYGSAILVGLSRVVENRHWASDVIAGAGVGFVSAQVVEHLTAAHPRNPVDRFLSGLRVVPGPDGQLLVAATMATP